MAPTEMQAHRAPAERLVAKAVMDALRGEEAALVVPQAAVPMVGTEVGAAITA